MEEILKYWPILAGIASSLANIIIVFFKINQHGQAISKDIAVINTKLEQNVGLRITDLESGHENTNRTVTDLSKQVNSIDKQLYGHLQIHKSNS